MKINLRHIKQADMQSLMSWARTREEIIQWSGPWNFTLPLDETQLAHFFMRDVLDDDLRRMQFLAVDADSGTPVGQIGFSRIWLRTSSAHLGPVIVAPAWRDRGIASQMVSYILDIGFRQMGLHRIELVVFDFNTAAIACYEKAGFRTEGLLRDIVRVGDAYWHWKAMSILDHEFLNMTGGQARSLDAP